MELVTPPGDVSSNDEKVNITVKFLREVHQKGFQNEITLRSYLLSKHGLTKPQVDEAFRIHKRMTQQDEAMYEGQTEGTPKEDFNRNSANSYGKSPFKEVTPLPESMAFLQENKKSEGQDLLQQFLRNELNYCNILECLYFEYYSALIEMADERRFDMTHEDLDQIFNRVPDLFSFHKDTFYTHLSQGMDIATTFLRFFKNLGQYAEYLKDCAATIKTMRKYTRDKKFHKCLEHIKRKSIRPNDDMTDLLLVPLDRISDYKQFLDKLQE